jgi:phosphate starvation-inducible protein PhoH
MQKISMEAIAYIRGRSIMNQYVIVDEAQNLTPHEVSTFSSLYSLECRSRQSLAGVEKELKWC